MRRVESVIDAWYDSGSMPFAQFHYPFENQERVRGALPGRLHLRGDRPDPRLVLHAARRVDAALRRRSSYRNCVCLGLILDPEGQKMSKSRGNVVEPWDVIAAHGADAFRWYYLTAQQPWAGYRFSVDTVGESVRQFLLTLWNTYSFWVLYANAEGLGPATSTTRPMSPHRRRKPQQPRRGPRPLGALAAAGDGRDGARAHGRLRLHRRRPGDRRLRRGALELVRAALAPPLLGGRPRRLRDPAPLPAGDRGAARPVHPLPRRRDPPQPGRRRGGGLRRAARLGPPARLPRGRRGAARPRAGGGDGGGAPHRRAGPRRARPGQGEDPPAAAPRRDRRHRRRARGDRAPAPSWSTPS